MSLKWRILEKDGLHYPQWKVEGGDWVTVESAFKNKVACYDSAEWAKEALKRLGVTVEEHVIT